MALVAGRLTGLARLVGLTGLVAGLARVLIGLLSGLAGGGRGGVARGRGVRVGTNR